MGRETYARIKGACTSVVGQSVQCSDVCFFARSYILVFGSHFLALQFPSVVAVIISKYRSQCWHVEQKQDKGLAI